MTASGSNFCPHLSFRISFHYDHNWTESIGDGINLRLGPNSTALGDGDCNSVTPRVLIPFGGGGDVEMDSKDDFDKKDFVAERETVATDQRNLKDSSLKAVCDICNPSSSTKNEAQWRCLDPRCGLVLCGASFNNHAQLHYEDSPHHMLQESVSTKRIWCNECQHEVLMSWNNRRPAPAVWVAPDGCEEEPPRGLYNIGNTCFMNAALQCMMAVTPLNSYLLGYSCNFAAGKQVGTSYLWLLSEMWNEQDGSYNSKSVMPARLLHAVRIAHPIFRGFHQHDTQEFLRLFMDSLTEETRIPHWKLEEEKKANKTTDEASSSSSDSEADSFETCDSGNGSEEAGTFHNGEHGPVSRPDSTLPDQRALNVTVELKSIVSEIFDGRLESSVQCLSCQQFSRRIEVFQDLSLPIPTKDEMIALKNAEKMTSDERAGWIGWFWDWFKGFFTGPVPTLEDCFSAFFSSDELKGKNMYSCEKCKKLRNGVKRCSLFQLPEVLCVHLKRFRLFEYGGGIGFSGKVNQYVQFPLEGLDLKPFLHSECTGRVTTYRLLGAIVHMGSFTGGHYIAYVRRGDSWYLCDDSRVVPTTPEAVAESEAYVLFYQKWDEAEDLTKQTMLQEWHERDNNPLENEKYHLLSRKWLTNFCWGEESGPIDNSDVVCPHGYFAPSEALHLAATWVPDSVWKIIHSQYGGGPDLVHHSECAACSYAWRKKQKLMQRTKGNSESSVTQFTSSANIPLLSSTSSSHNSSSSSLKRE